MIRSRAVFEDPSGRLTIEQVIDKNFSDMGAMLSRGFTNSAFWIRVNVIPDEDGVPVRLRIVPTVLDDVRLYEPDPNTLQGWKVLVGGDQYSFDSGHRSIQSLGFVVHPKAPSTTYYIRIQTTSSSLAFIEAVSLGESSRKDAKLVFIQVFYLWFMASALSWALKSYLQQRDKVTGLFIAQQFSGLLVSFALMGYLSVLEAPGSTGLSSDITNIVVFLNVVFSALFHKEVFALFMPKRILLTLLNIIAFVFLGCLVAYLAGWKHFALHARALALFVFSVLLVLLALTAKQRGFLSLKILRSAYIILSLSLLAALLPGLGWVEGDPWVLLGILVYGFISASVMLYLVSQRSRQLLDEANERLRQGEFAIQQLKIEKQYANEQERFFDMLTHEIKTPISVALMSLGALKSDSPHLSRIKRALQSINDIVDRSRLVELARHKRLTIKLATINASERVYECIEASSDPDRINASVGFGLEAHTDSQLFGIIVANLIDNALKYSPHGAPVELTFQPHGDNESSGSHLLISNAIGAAGIPDPAQLFKKYYRSPGAQNKTGSGLGLNLSMHLATMIGARLSCKVKDNKVEFELWLPACES